MPIIAVNIKSIKNVPLKFVPPISANTKYVIKVYTMPVNRPLTNPILPLIVKKHPINNDITFINWFTGFTTEDDNALNRNISANIKIPIKVAIKENNAPLIIDNINPLSLILYIKNPRSYLIITMQGLLILFVFAIIQRPF